MKKIKITKTRAENTPSDRTNNDAPFISDKPRKKRSNTFFWQTTLIVFISQFANLILFYGLGILGLDVKIFDIERISPIATLSIMLAISIAVGIAISVILGRAITRPVQKLKKATHDIARGNFNVDIKPTKNGILNEFIDDFNAMADKLKSIETLKSDFISNVSHEFKTPISVISSYAKALKRTDLDPETRAKYEKVLDNNIIKLTTLTSNILSLSKIENQRIDIEKSEFLIDEQIRNSILSLESRWSAKNLQFDLDIPETKYFGAKDLIAQVWQNLLSNAVKFSLDHGTITVSISSNEKEVSVSISDQGIGMDEQTAEKVFDKFFQADPSRFTAGNGLGLTLAKRIVDIHGGTITVKSVKDKGSTFTVILPINN